MKRFLVLLHIFLLTACSQSVTEKGEILKEGEVVQDKLTGERVLIERNDANGRVDIRTKGGVVLMAVTAKALEKIKEENDDPSQKMLKKAHK